MKKRKFQERGQALILVALAAIGLVGFAALAIDGSRVFSDRRHAQNAADTAALAAALSTVRADPPETAVTVAEAAGIARAASNGYDNTNSIVEVNNCAELDLVPVCEGLPEDANPAEYIQVVIRLTTQTTFARVLGRTEVASVVSAVARAEPGGPEPVGDGFALYAASLHERAAIKGTGNFSLDVINSGVFDNSDYDDCAFFINGNGTYEVDTSFTVVGDMCSGFNSNLKGTQDDGASQRPYPPPMDVLTPSITCNGDGAYDAATQTYAPGNHNNLNIPNGNIIFAPGNHCFYGGVSINGNTNILAVGANFLIASGEFQSNTNGTFTCNNLLVHINGGTGFRINGNSTNNCKGVTFFASTGDVSWNGNSETNFTAPTWGPYQGLLIYLPYGNDSPLTINGNTQSSLTGSIVAVSSPIKVNGTGTTLALRTAIIGYTVDLGGTGSIVIDYRPEDQFTQIDPTSIQVTK